MKILTILLVLLASSAVLASNKLCPNLSGIYNCAGYKLSLEVKLTAEGKAIYTFSYPRERPSIITASDEGRSPSTPNINAICEGKSISLQNSEYVRYSTQQLDNQGNYTVRGSSGVANCQPIKP